VFCLFCFVVVFRLFDCFVFSLDVCCRCTVLFLYAYTRVVIIIYGIFSLHIILIIVTIM
jgi:hypothetical protein